MKLRQIVVLLTIGTLMMTSATPVPTKSLTNSKNEGDDDSSRSKVVGTCLRIAPNLPPCNFDSEATWRSRSGEILNGDSPSGSAGYPLGELPEFFGEGNAEKILTVEPAELKDGNPISTGEKNPEEFDFYENDLAITVVYYLEGCLPARLPFDVPSCPIEELQTIQMNKLVPFQLPDVEDALIFPEIDIKQIEFSHRQSRAPSRAAAASQSHEESKGNNIGFNDSSTKNQKLWNRSSSFLAENRNGVTVEIGDVEKSVQGVQDLHKTMVKSNTNPRTGTASTKYFSMLGGSSSRSMVSNQAWDRSEKRNTERSAKDVNESESKSSLEEDRSESVYGTREIGDTFAKDKNRVQ